MSNMRRCSIIFFFHLWKGEVIEDVEVFSVTTALNTFGPTHDVISISAALQHVHRRNSTDEIAKCVFVSLRKYNTLDYRACFVYTP
jgi:hypothetical protein